MGSFRIIKKGLQSSIQDIGRFGFRKLGIPSSGALDPKSMRDANNIVGNPETYPVIEHTFYGGIYEFDASCLISITGANCNPTLNGNPLPMYSGLKIHSGDKIEFNYPTRGCRSYLAVQGLFDIPQLMNSYSTYLPGKFGGYFGRSLNEEDKVCWNSHDFNTKAIDFPKNEIPYFSTKVSVNIKAGPEFELLNEKDKKQLFGTNFRVSTQTNRMGIRLEGSVIKLPGFEIVSSPVVPGVIQLPASGHPIILMNDGQTIGGYPRIGIVMESELWRLGQVKQGDLISFKLT